MHVSDNLPVPWTDRHYIKKHICFIHDILECEPPQRRICFSTWSLACGLAEGELALRFDDSALFLVQALLPDCGLNGTRCLLLLLPWLPHNDGLCPLEGKPNKRLLQPLCPSTGKGINKLSREIQYNNSKMVAYALSPIHSVFRMTISIPKTLCKITSTKKGRSWCQLSSLMGFHFTC